MNIFNDAARPHRATWLSPFFVVIEFSKAMWQIHNGFKSRFPATETSTSFAEAKKVNLPSCSSGGLVSSLHGLKAVRNNWQLSDAAAAAVWLATSTYWIPPVRKRCEWQRLMCFSAHTASRAATNPNEPQEKEHNDQTFCQRWIPR